MKPTLRIFISSPGDVSAERMITRRVIARLDAELADIVTLEPYIWEHEPFDIAKSFQEQIPKTEAFDIVLCMLWTRLGSKLHNSLKMPDGSEAPSGMLFEVAWAMHGQRLKGLPEIQLWWKRALPEIPLEPAAELDRRVAQYREVGRFVESISKDPATDTIVGAFTEYRSLDEFEELLKEKLRRSIHRRMEAMGIGTADSDADVAMAPTITWEEGSPFRGLLPFEFEHAPILFGRTAAVGQAKLKPPMLRRNSCLPRLEPFPELKESTDTADRHQLALRYDFPRLTGRPTAQVHLVAMHSPRPCLDSGPNFERPGCSRTITNLSFLFAAHKS